MTPHDWPATCKAKGQWFQVPKALIKRAGYLQLKPSELMLVLMLSADAYPKRTTRYYWEELADWCGRDRNTVRKWAYSLKRKKLLTIRTNRKLNKEETRRPGYRNERNEFSLAPLMIRLEQVQALLDAERASKKRKEARHEAPGR